jgi:hypothetical protein
MEERGAVEIVVEAVRDFRADREFGSLDISNQEN